MPAVSKAQFRWFKAAERRGEVTPKVADEFTKGVAFSKLPDRNSSRQKRGAGRRAGRV